MSENQFISIVTVLEEEFCKKFRRMSVFIEMEEVMFRCD